MEPNPNKPNNPVPPNYQFLRSIFFWLILAVIIANLVGTFSSSFAPPEKIPYSQFYKLLQDNDKTQIISYIRKIDSKLEGQFTPVRDSKKFYVFIPDEDKDLLELLKTKVPRFDIEPINNFFANMFYSVFPIVLFILFIWYFAYRGSRGAGGASGIWSFGKIRARLADKTKAQKTFVDVAGVDEAKEELSEVIDFLKDPKKFQKLGGRIPKGVLLVGPPGCGKTLLAKAVAGEAEVPFYSISGSDFVEMFVGVGASRVRDLFEQAKKASKTSGKGCIIFIDEIDAVGRQRFAGIGGGHDEREQTLNQLLVEMDGFISGEGIIVMAATNRPDVLDPALLRPGRFDRHVVIDLPDIKGREEILRVHTKNVKLSPQVDLAPVARQTPGFSGADLENLCNEAALLSARRNKEVVEQAELEEAIERVMAGPQRKSRVISKREKEIVSIHESGHALLSVFLDDVDPLHKVSIMPRGFGALGYTLQLPLQDRYIMAERELFAKIVILMGGRVAEKVLLGEITTGAGNDLEVATKMARRMVTDFGMNRKIGNITLGHKEGPVFLGRDLVEHKDYSEYTAQLIDGEVRDLLERAYKKAEEELTAHLEQLKKLSAVLLEKEILSAEEVKKILGVNDSSKENARTDTEP